MLVIACGCVMNEVRAAGFPSCRLVLSIMGFIGFINCYTLRVNLSVAIVAMVNTTYLRQLESEGKDVNSTATHDVCAVENDVNTTADVVDHSVRMNDRLPV